jgi:two-component system sensor histidine kinase BaeS
MRTKLFLAFFAVIITALISNLIYQRLILKDFDDYIGGSREDRLYWLLASVEGSYMDGSWQMPHLKESIHWAMMLGFDASVEDASGKLIISSKEVYDSLPDMMRRRMEGIVVLEDGGGEFEKYPLFAGGSEIGSLVVRPLMSEKLMARKKELAFKQRGKDFLVISFLIAGGGAVFLSVLFSLFLSGPVRKLKAAAEAVSMGNLDVKVPAKSKDEIGSLTEAFNRMVETLKREEALRRHLTSNIAHELRTPLSIIRADVEAMLDGVIKDSKEGLKDLLSEIGRLTALIEGIEDITKAEASFFSPAAYDKVSIREFIGGIFQGMSPLFIKKGIELRLEEKDDFIVRTDGEKLEKILRNLLTNALRHTEKGGVRVDYGSEKNEFYISVTDTGEGIPEEGLHMVFKRFYKGEGSGGSGLGLAIARELADVMGGKIEVKSRVGEGSAFKVWLPMRDKAA